MSAPLVVNTKDGTCWTQREGTRGGEALYAPEKCGSCPAFVMATLTELAEHGIVGSADALPMPFGPQMPPFPPAPETFEEKLRQDVARLQGLLAEAVADKHRAQRERDLIRERVAEPYGCALCGVAKRAHGRRYITGAGVHVWERPSDTQVKERMLARRAVCADVKGLRAYGARMHAVNAGLRARVAEMTADNEALQRDKEQVARVAERRLSKTDVAAWLRKKARECPSAPERQESAPAAIARLADKVARGAIRVESGGVE